MDEFSRNLAGAVAAAPGIAELERDIPAFRIAKGLQTTPEGVGERMRRRRGHQHADVRQLSRLLRPRPKWPRDRYAAEQCDEVAPSHAEPSRRVPQSGISLARRIAWDMWTVLPRRMDRV